jgi:hypothetical protein
MENDRGLTQVATARFRDLAAAWLGGARTSMPIGPYLEGHQFDPEAVRVMGIAFEMAKVALRLADHGDLANEMLGQGIIALAKAGEARSRTIVLHLSSCSDS